MAEKINVSEKLEEGYISIRTIIEMMGRPKEHLMETLKSYVKKLSESDNYEVLNEEYSEPKEEDGMFNVFVEVEMLVKNIEEVAWFSFDYMPASIEILEPEKLNYKAPELTNFLNDLLGRLHHLDMSFKTKDASIKKLNANSEAILKNFIGYLIKDEPKTVDELSEPLGIGKEQLERLLDRLIGNKYLRKEDDKYFLA
ncbi:MAG: hypothetical protein ACLFPQ_01690 [Candidatus Woesearchaeota archaeon]